MPKLPTFSDRIDQRLVVIAEDGKRWYPYRRKRRDGKAGYAFAGTFRSGGCSLDVYFETIEEFIDYVIVKKSGTGSFVQLAGLPHKNISWRTKRIAKAYEVDEGLRDSVEQAQHAPRAYFTIANRPPRDPYHYSRSLLLARV